MNILKVIKPLFQLARIFSAQKKMRLILILILTLVTSFSEVISIGSIVPFIAVLHDPKMLNKYFPLHDNLNIAFQYPQASITLIFCLFVILAAALRVYLLISISKFSFSTGVELGTGIYKNSLNRRYFDHLKINSSEIISLITEKVGTVIGAILMSLTLASSLTIFISVSIFLIFVEPILSISALCFFSITYYIVGNYFGGRVYSNGVTISKYSTVIHQMLQEGLIGIREIILYDLQPKQLEIFREADSVLRGAQGRNSFMGSSPRYVVEAIGMVGMAVIAFDLSKGLDGDMSGIAVVGMLALAAQKMLPLLQQIYASWVGILGAHKTIETVIAGMANPMMGVSTTVNFAAKFTSRIEMRNIGYGFTSEKEPIIRNLNATFYKGEVIGILGKSGCGKSTFLDLLIGFLRPIEGCLYVDGVEILSDGDIKSWQSNISFVPQSIFLMDASIAENIAFGENLNDIDYQELDRCIRCADLMELVNSSPEGYRMKIGERGTRISGGQRQRIGIARALYKKRPILVLDEATSALDSKTEKIVLDNIYGTIKNLTIFIVTHRLSTLQGCDRVFTLSKLGLVRTDRGGISNLGDSLF